MAGILLSFQSYSHDYVTGAQVCGPNVFYNCTASQTFADIGPHHRWSVGTLYDNIVTDGEINVQDRGQMGSGHGWAGVTQVLWNCRVNRAAVRAIIKDIRTAYLCTGYIIMTAFRRLAVHKEILLPPVIEGITIASGNK